MVLTETHIFICLHCRKQMSKGKLNILMFPKLTV